MSNQDNNSNDYSFESILADVKGTAFIDGDKKTPPDELEEKANRILREAAELSGPPSKIKAVTEKEMLAGIASAVEDAMPAGVDMQSSAETTLTGGFSPSAADISAGTSNLSGEQELLLMKMEPDFSDTVELPMLTTMPEDKQSSEKQNAPLSPFGAAMNAASTAAANPGESPTIVVPMTMPESDSQPEAQDEITKRANRIFDQYSEQAEQVEQIHVTKPVDIATDEQTHIHLNEPPSQDAHFSQDSQAQFNPIAQTNRITLFDQDISHDGEDFEYAPIEEEIFDEPALRVAAGKFAKACNSISLRVVPASVITLIMILITYVYEAGMVVPFGIGYNLDLAACVLVICLLFVMMLCVDVIIRGVDFLVGGVPNAETLILFSCVFSLISAIFTRLSGTAMMLPFCAVSALTLVFAAFGERFNLRAMTDTLKTAVGSSEPYGVQAEYNVDIDKSVLKKSYNRTDGFYNNLMQPDITELLYRYAAPTLLIGALLLTVITVIAKSGVENSLHILSALLAAAAPFSILLSFSVPFAMVAKTVRKSGAALAGWGGADDICFTDGVCVTDDDLFPPGTLRLSGVKVYDGAAPDKAMRYTASLIIASGSGLASLFIEVLKSQNVSPMRVENFECHESGIGAVIRGEQISTGSAAFMNLLGVRVPDDSNLKNAVYTAVNNRLVAMFAVEYKPLPSVQNALISMLKWRIDLFFAMRDFNVTPSMVGQRFKVPFEGFVFIPVKDAYSISDPYSGKQGRMASVLVREGLGPFADVITGGRLLKSAAFFATILSIVSAALGVFIMFLMCWSGSFVSASPGNLIIFMLCMLATVLIVCGYVKLKK